MIWILLLYVLPLVISIVGAYFVIRKDNGTVEDLLKEIPLFFIPLFNIIFILAGICFLTQDWLDNNDDWQNFLNKKL